MTTRISRAASGEFAPPARARRPEDASAIGAAVVERSNIVKSLLVQPLVLAEEDPGGDPYNRAGCRVAHKG